MAIDKIIGRPVKNTVNGKSEVEIFAKKENNKYYILDKETAKKEFPNKGTLFISDYSIDDAYYLKICECDIVETRDFRPEAQFSIKYKAENCKLFKDLYQVIQISASNSLPQRYITKEELDAYIPSIDITNENPFYLLYNHLCCGPFEMKDGRIQPSNKSDRDQGLISEYEIDDKDILTLGSKKYLLDIQNLTVSARSPIDCMNNEQLKDWFLKRFADFFKEDDAYNILPETFFDDFRGSEKITRLEEARLRRVEQTYTNLWNTYESLKVILSTNNKISEEEPYTLIQELRDLYEKDKNRLIAELNNLDTKKIEELKMQTQTSSNVSFNIENYIKIEERLSSSNDNYIVKNYPHPAYFVKDIKTPYEIAKEAGNVRIFTLHIEHDWLHYDDFCKHGLLEMWNYAHEHKEENVFIILDCINITYAEGGLKPLLDAIKYYNDKDFWLLGTNKPFPENLKIWATCLPWEEENSVGIKLNKSLFETWIPDHNRNEENNNIQLPY